MSSSGWPLPAVVGVAGYSRSGKSTLANQLVGRCGFRVLELKEELLRTLALLDPLVCARPPEGPTPDSLVWSAASRRWWLLMDEFGYEGAKDHPVYGREVRRLLQVMGTEVGRGVFGENVWSDALFRKRVGGEPIVIPDCRFPSDVAAVRRRGGIVVRVERPGVGPVNSHGSESALDDIPMDLVVHNDGPPVWMLEQLGMAYMFPGLS